LQVAKEVFGGHGGAHQSVSCRRGNARHIKHLSLQLLDQKMGGTSSYHRGAVFDKRGRDRGGDSLRGEGLCWGSVVAGEGCQGVKISKGMGSRGGEGTPDRDWGVHQDAVCRRGDTRQCKHLSLQLLNQEMGRTGGHYRGANIDDRRKDRGGDSWREQGLCWARVVPGGNCQVAKSSGGREAGVEQELWAGISQENMMFLIS